jgi:hypothetical protein
MPLADFVCNSPKCRTKKGEAPVYELPIKATHCPMGHKRVVRLFNKVNVNLGIRSRERFDGRHTSSSMAARVDAIAEGPYNEAMAKADTLKAASAANIKATRERFPLINVVPSARLQATMAGIFPNAPLAAPAPPGKAHKSTADLGQLGALPTMREATAITARDTEHKLGRKADGTLEIKKA